MLLGFAGSRGPSPRCCCALCLFLYPWFRFRWRADGVACGRSSPLRPPRRACSSGWCAVAPGAGSSGQSARCCCFSRSIRCVRCAPGSPQARAPTFSPRRDEPRRRCSSAKHTRKPPRCGCPHTLLPPEAPLHTHQYGPEERSSKSTGAALGAAALPINRAWCARGRPYGCPAHAYGTTRVVGTEPRSGAAPGAREGLPSAR